MKKLLFLSAVPLALAMSSCTINDKGEFELTWLFWFVLIIFAVLAISGHISRQQEAEARGISVDELVEEKRRELEKQQMESGIDVEYLGGYPLWLTPCKVNFNVRNTSIVLRKGSESLVIPKEDIISISNERSGKRNVGKAAAGAILGGVLTGGLGAIAGGAIGAKRLDTSEIFVSYKYNGVELTLDLRPGKNIDKMYSQIYSVFA